VGRRRAATGATPALRAAAAAGVDVELHEYRHTEGVTAFGDEVVAQLDADPATVFKTLVAEIDGAPAVAVLPVPARLDPKALAAALGGKRARLADAADAERITGYVVGGVSPLGQRQRLPTVLDASARDHPRILVSAGRRGLQMGLAPADLVALTDPVVAPITAPAAGGAPGGPPGAGRDPRRGRRSR